MIILFLVQTYISNCSCRKYSIRINHCLALHRQGRRTGMTQDRILDWPSSTLSSCNSKANVIDRGCEIPPKHGRASPFLTKTIDTVQCCRKRRHSCGNMHRVPGPWPSFYCNRSLQKMASLDGLWCAGS
jgi:hypothetical protein